MGSCISLPDRSVVQSIENIEARRFFELFRVALLNLVNTETEVLSFVRDQLAAVSQTSSSFGLTFSGHPLSYTTVTALCECIKQSSSITELRLDSCSISEVPGVFELVCHCLSGTCSLVFIDLSDNGLNATHMLQLSSSLSSNSFLQKLDISFNNIGPNGFKSLSRSLQRNMSISNLALKRCSLGPTSVPYLCSLLKLNKTLTCLDLSENLLDRKSIESLSATLVSNPYFTYFKIDGNDVTSSIIKNFESILIRNSSINELFDVVLSNVYELAHIHEDQKELQSFAPDQSSSLSTSISVKSWYALPPLTVPPSSIPSLDYSSTPLSVITPGYSNVPWLKQSPSPNQVLVVGHAETIGRRPEMEDTVTIQHNLGGLEHVHYVGVFDGHGGSMASEYAGNNLHHLLFELLKSNRPVTAIRDAFMKINSQIVNCRIEDGTTALIMLLIGNRRIIANCGDTRAVLCRQGKAVRLSFDHKPSVPEETERIKSLGGFVDDDRVLGTLGVSRALGDAFLQPYVSSKPYISVTEVTPQDQFLIMACDGLWDVVSDEDSVRLISTEVDVNQAAVRLRDHAFKNGSNDNISVCVVKFF
ncbi:hypothetical protein RCL1_006689 [Eukaryota sp. TZLM3-RCL]